MHHLKAHPAQNISRVGKKYGNGHLRPLRHSSPASSSKYDPTPLVQGSATQGLTKACSTHTLHCHVSLPDIRPPTGTLQKLSRLPAGLGDVLLINAQRLENVKLACRMPVIPGAFTTTVPAGLAHGRQDYSRESGIVRHFPVASKLRKESRDSLEKVHHLTSYSSAGQEVGSGAHLETDTRQPYGGRLLTSASVMYMKIHLTHSSVWSKTRTTVPTQGAD